MKHVNFKVNQHDLARINYCRNTLDGYSMKQADFFISAALEKCDRILAGRGSCFPAPVPHRNGTLSTQAAIFNIGLTANELLVFMYLYCCDKQGQKVLLSYANIAQKCSLSKRTVLRTIKLLEKRGLVAKSRRQGDLSNSYVLQIPARGVVEHKEL